MTFDFVKVTIKSRFLVGSTINFVHYVFFQIRTIVVSTMATFFPLSVSLMVVW